MNEADQRELDDIKMFVEGVADHESEWRSDSENELDFLNSNQWPQSNNPNSGSANTLPTHVINAIPAFLNQIINQAKQNRPSIKVHPIGGGADIEVAKVLQGYFKHMENVSFAENAYDRALECAVQVGRGFIRLYTDYCNERSFEQDIFIGSIFNPFSVYYDPFSTDVVGADCEECVITSYEIKREITLLNPELENAYSLQDDFSADTGNDVPDPWWFNDEKKMIRVAERFKKRYNDDRLIRFRTGHIVYESEMDLPENVRYKNIKIADSRKELRAEIAYMKVTGLNIVARSIVPGKIVPVFPVYGNRNCIRGSLRYNGLIKLLQDPQYMYNYWRSKETQVVSQAPNGYWQAYQEVIEGYESDYENAGTRPQAVLKANAVASADGIPTLLPLPIRIQPQDIPSGIIGAAENSHKDMQMVSGIYETALGAQGNEISGEAIDGRVNQANIGAWHYQDNLTKTVTQLARAAVKMIPKVIDTERMIRIIQPDSSSKMVTVNERVLNPLTEAVEKVKNDLTVGEYDVTLNTGPAFATRRQESSAMILELAKVWPEIMEFGGDILLKNLDIEESQELAARAGALMPPEVQGIGDEDEDIPPRIKALLANFQAQNKQITQELQQATNEFTQQIELAKLNAETEITIERIKHESSVFKTSMTNDGKKDVEEIKAMVQILMHHLQMPPELAAAAKKDLQDDTNNSEQMRNQAQQNLTGSTQNQE